MKSQKFWERKAELRKQPGNCVRCGHANPDASHKTCPRCREQIASRRQKYLRQTVKVETLVSLRRRIESLEMAVAQLQLDGGKRYQNGYSAGKKAAAKRDYFGIYPTITKQELATMNHAYDNDRREYA